MSAFGGDPARTLAGCLVGTDDAGVMAEATGIPPAITGVMVVLSCSLPQADAEAAAVAWFEAIAPGADLADVPQAIVLGLLDAPAYRSLVARVPDAEPLLEGLISAHRQAATPPAAWRDLRKRAVALTQRTPLGDRATVRMLEVAAWPTTRAPELPVDLFWANVIARQEETARIRGVTPEQPGDDTLMDRVLDELIAGGMDKRAAHAGLEQTIEERHPRFAARSRATAAIMDEILPKAAAELNEIVLSALRRATPAAHAA